MNEFHDLYGEIWRSLTYKKHHNSSHDLLLFSKCQVMQRILKESQGNPHWKIVNANFDIYTLDG
ncbi:MAG: hypothetical protein AAF378_17635 [Cyanobacteria bacterium P01_A01_bin.84]